MSRKATWSRLNLLVCLALLTAFWVAEAQAEDMYACKCKGIESDYRLAGTCGNGYEVARKGRVDKDIPKSKMHRYLPGGSVSGLYGLDDCAFSRVSGWRCGRMVGDILPICTN